MPVSGAHNSSEEINSWIAAFQDGDQKAGERLLKAFEGYLVKYYRLLRDGSWNRNDTEIVSFLQKFMNRDPDTAARFICQGLARLEDADIRQELALLLLSTALRFGYITKHFKIGLHGRIWSIIHDPISYASFSPHLMMTVHGDVYEMEPSNELGEDFVLGKRVNDDRLAKLTPVERLILKLAYWDKLSDREIAKILTRGEYRVGRAQVRQKRERAKAALAQTEEIAVEND